MAARETSPLKGDKTPVVTENAKCCLERAVRMRESLSNVSNSLNYLYLYCERKASEIKNSYLISLDAQKCEEEDAEFDVYIKLILKLLKDFITCISRVVTQQGSKKASIQTSPNRLL